MRYSVRYSIWRRVPLASLLLMAMLLMACAQTSTIARQATATPQPSATGPAPTTSGTPGNLSTLRLALTRVASGLENPVYVTAAPDGSGRLYIVEQAGRIRVLERDGQLRAEPFLDIRSRVLSGGERGLLSVVFSPRFTSDGLFYVDYTDANGDTVVARYHATGTPPRADPASARRILFVRQPAPNHNGGLLLFGPDGYLYVGMGDGGAGASGNAQRKDTLLGKLLRVDVSRSSAGKAYAIPSDNPFVGDSGAQPEIWAYGLRNPWRFSFDRAAGDLYIADVGQVTTEEVDFQPRASQGGENYGWDEMEGRTCYRQTCSTSGKVPPIATYGHGAGDCAITGGYVYRGERSPALRGIYLYGDYCSGRIWGLAAANLAPGQQVATRELIRTPARIVSFGEDETGELYVVDLNGGVYQVSAQ